MLNPRHLLLAGSLCGCLFLGWLGPTAWSWSVTERPLGLAAVDETVTSEPAGEHASPLACYHSPRDLVVQESADWLVTVNETSDSITLVRLSDGKVLDELPTADRPWQIRLCLGGTHVAVTTNYGGTLELFRVADGRLTEAGRIELGFEPGDLAVAPDGDRAYVSLISAGQVAEVDLESLQILRRFDVGAWPRHLTLTPDGQRLAVGLSGESSIAVIDVASGQRLYDEPLVGGINIGHLQCSADGLYAYFPWMVYRSNPINPGNIRLGWVLASRIGRVRLDGSSYREAISLDAPGRAVADPHGLAITPNEHRLVVTSSGTHELLVYRLGDLPFIGIGGPGDLIERELLRDSDLFSRIELGGRPLAVVAGADSRTVYVANALRDSIQIVNIESREIVREIDLAAREVSPQAAQLRQGMALFYDAQRSLDQWYSCHSCHYDGGTNSKAMDTHNDGSELTMKTVLPLHGLTDTAPWTWHGWQTDLDEAMQKSFTVTMQGKPVAQEDRAALVAYLKTLTLPPNPYRDADGSLSAAAERGREVFRSETAGCLNCHSGPHLTDGQIHDVGLGSPGDAYEGFNTPSLLGVHRKVLLLHDGRAKTLEDVLTGAHAAELVEGQRALTDDELADLIAYLKSL